MYKTIDAYEFASAFESSDTYKNNFSRPALFALYNYIEQYYQDIEAVYEFDMVALCCEYSEYASAWDAMLQYQPDDMPTLENSEGMDLLEIQTASEKIALEWLKERTQVISFTGGIIIAQF